MAHDWEIAEREYACQPSRRGKLHAYESLKPTSTALVVAADANAALTNAKHNAALHMILGLIAAG